VTDPGYFDHLYAVSPDPWRLSTSEYETRKYDITIASLPRARYRRGFEPGCAIGVLTGRLARRCSELIAWDGAATAVTDARRRVDDPTVRIEQARVPDSWPDGVFDLIVISELLYFLGPADRLAVTSLAAGCMEPGGHVVAVDWRHPFDEAPTSGDVVHRELRRRPEWKRIGCHLERDFLLDVFEVAR
jgi:SAM-dependent methyltransferase